MNELRMYVERLFEGRVLTAENIELKEEIYGNLVARYEDYIAEGMDEADALAKTMASITSIEDVVGNGSGAEKATPPAADTSGETPARSAAAPDEPAAAGTTENKKAAPESVPVTQPMPAVNTEPRPDANTTQEQTKSTPTSKEKAMIAGMPRKKFFTIVAIVVVILLVCAGGIYAIQYMGNQNKRTEDAVATQRQTIQDSASTSNGATAAQGSGSNTSSNATSGTGSTGSSASNSTSGTGTSSAQQYLDPEDQLEYEATSALLAELDANEVSTLKSAANGNMTATELFQALPMGSALNRVHSESHDSTLSVSYTNVSDNYDGDAVDAVLVYNAAAAFAVYPDISTVEVSLHEQYDHEHDADYYVFTRSNLESSIASTSSNAITQLNSSLFDSSSSWDEVRTCVTGHNFADHQIDLADIYDD